MENLKRVEISSFNVYLGSGIEFDDVITTLPVNIFEYEALEFRFTTPGSDSVVSWGIVRPPFNSYKFGFEVVGYINGISSNRKPTSVVLQFNPITKHLLLCETAERAYVHILGVWGIYYELINANLL